MKLKELISKAEEKKVFAYEKYKIGKDEIPVTNAMQYYMDMSNAFLELIEGLKKLTTSDVDNNGYFYVVEIRKYYPKGSTPYTEHSCLFLSDKLDKSISFIRDDVNDKDGFTSNGKNYHWYWVVIKMKLNDDTGDEIIKVYDKNGVETTESIMLDLEEREGDTDSTFFLKNFYTEYDRYYMEKSYTEYDDYCRVLHEGGFYVEWLTKEEFMERIKTYDDWIELQKSVGLIK